MDKIDNAPFFASNEPAELDEEGNPIVPDEALNFTPKDIGLSTKPGATLPELQASIKQGAGRVEFSFMPVQGGKGNAQNPTPESIGSGQRRDMRELLKINDVKTSTHAGVHAASLAGFTGGERGFSSESRAQTLKDINKAIHFAGEATRGGAVVFHMHEWQRPLTDVNGKSGANFKYYDEEDAEAVMFAVDKRTGELVSTISKNREVFRPKYKTATSEGLVGKKDSKGNVLKEGDWVDLDGNLIPRDAPTERLFDRVPVFNEDSTKFEVEQLTWDQLKKETEEWNKLHPDDKKDPEEMFAILNTENRILQSKGASLFHARQYDEVKYSRDKLAEEYKLYKKLKNELPEEEHWKLDSRFMKDYQLRDYRDEDSPEEYYERKLKMLENDLRHVHESSASADVQAKQAESLLENIESAKKYGIKKTAETIAKAGMKAMEVYNKNKEQNELTDPIYVAPENWHQNFYGSHPSEMKEVVLESRKAMIDQLKRRNYSEDEAKKLAEQHIKATLDVGHLNTLRYNFVAKDESKFDEEFNKWLVDETEKLVAEGIVGHIHLSDNFGFDDEHLTPGDGNLPVKEIMKRLEKHDKKDIIIERGSYNENTGYLDTFAHINAPMYGLGARQRFAQNRDAHFGQNAPGFFIAGAYAPSNDWKLWSDTPLE